MNINTLSDSGPVLRERCGWCAAFCRLPAVVFQYQFSLQCLLAMHRCQVCRFAVLFGMLPLLPPSLVRMSVTVSSIASRVVWGRALRPSRSPMSSSRRPLPKAPLLRARATQTLSFQLQIFLTYLLLSLTQIGISYFNLGGERGRRFIFWRHEGVLAH